MLENTKKDICEYCNGTGEIEEMEQVYPNEPHYAPTGKRKCICQLEGNIEENN